MKTLALFGLTLVLLASCARERDSSPGKDQSSGGKQSAPAAAADPAKVTISGTAQQKTGIRVARVELRSVPVYLTAAGEIRTNEERTAHIGTYTDGRVTEIHANIGDPVRKGDILARMHSHDVHETRAAYESALQQLEQKQTALEYQTRMRDRMRRLFDLKSASRQEVERAEADLRASSTDLANAKIAVAKEMAHLTDILNLPPAALSSLTETTEQVPVVTPISGVVIDRKITPGAVIEPGQEVFTVSDLSVVWLMASVNETDIGRVRRGNKVRVFSQAFPDVAFSGHVVQVGPELDPQTRTFQVRIVVPNPGLRLRPGMYATAQIQQGVTEQRIFVPEEAVQEVNGSSVVFVRRQDNAFELTPVQIAHRLNGEAEISAGLRAGDAVVEKGSFIVKSELLKSQIGE